MQTLFGILMFFSALFLILLVLIQRGRGGGLAGAFGGMGGHSAFGTKAGDRVMWWTVYLAGAWIALCAAAVLYSNKVAGGSAFSGAGGDSAAETAPADEVGSSGDSRSESKSGGRAAGSAPGKKPADGGVSSEGAEKD